MEIFVHISNNGEKQTLEEHLEGTAGLASGFAITELKEAARGG